MSTRYNTGNPIESTDVRDMSDNAKNFDEFSNSKETTFTDRFGVARKTLPSLISNAEQDIYYAVINAGFQPASFDFVTGGTLVSGDRNKAVFNPSPSGDNNWYAWQGAFPKIISPNSTPSTSGGLGDNAWKPVTNNILAPTVMESIRRSYAEAGYNLVDGSFEAGGTLVNVNDVLLQESTGKGYTGPAGPVAAGANPASGGFVDVSFSVKNYATVSILASGLYRVGSTVEVSDRNYGKFKVVAGGTPDGFGVVDAGNGNTAHLISYDVYVPEYFGASGVRHQDARPYLEALVARLRAEGGGALKGKENSVYNVSLTSIGADRVGVVFDFDNIKWLAGGVFGLLDGQLDSETSLFNALVYSFKKPDLSEMHNIVIDDVSFDGNLRGQKGYFNKVGAVYSYDTLTLYNVVSGYATYSINDYTDSAAFIVAGKDYKVRHTSRGDFKQLKSVSISSGSNRLTSEYPVFSVGDIGKNIYIVGAGAYAGSGANNALLRTEILSYVSPNEVLLRDNALTTVVNLIGTFGSTDAGLYLSGNGGAGTTTPSDKPRDQIFNGSLPSGLVCEVNASDTTTACHCLRGLKDTTLTVSGSNLVVGTDITVLDGVDGYGISNKVVNGVLRDVFFTPLFTQFGYGTVVSSNQWLNVWQGPSFEAMQDFIVSNNLIIGMFGYASLGSNAGITISPAIRNGVSYPSKHNLISDNSIKGFWNGITSSGDWNQFNNNLIRYTRANESSNNGQYNISSSKYKLDGVWVVPDRGSLATYPIPQIRGQQAVVSGVSGLFVFNGVNWENDRLLSGSSTVSGASSFQINHNLGFYPTGVRLTSKASLPSGAVWWIESESPTAMVIRYSAAITATINWVLSV